MKSYLMYADQDFGHAPATPAEGRDVVADLVQDLELDTLWDAMAAGDKFLRVVASNALLSSLTDVEQIRFRQHVLADCLAHPDLVREIYGLAVEAVDGERKIFRSLFSDHGERQLHRSIEVIELFVGILRRLRELAERHSGEFRSSGFTRFFAELRIELDDDYFDEIRSHLHALRFGDGLVISERLGAGNRGSDDVVRSPRPENRGRWFSHAVLKKPTYAFTIPPRDEAGARALSELRDRGVSRVAKALDQSASHILGFFTALRVDLGFYVGALNLHQALDSLGGSVCFADPEPVGQLRLTARSMYDPCLALRMGRTVVGNDLDADGKDLLVVTGANQGGKSTFLRSLGLSHLMMQAGLFVPASTFSAAMIHGVLTHYKREEDASMRGGKFDEELARMSAIVDHIGSGCLLLCNESFAATNELEGSDIAAGVVHGMRDAGVRVVYVTHMYDLARRYEHSETTLFLRADRGEDGQRSFRLRVAPPLPTSFGEDLYERTFLPGRSASGAPGSSGELSDQMT